MNINIKTLVSLFALAAVVVLGGKLSSVPIQGTLMAQSDFDSAGRRVLGPVVAVSEAESELQFVARVDTGARTCSLHTTEKLIDGGAKFMEDNVGKTIRFRVDNRQGESQWLERRIAEVRKIRTSEGEETRYLVPMQLTVDGVEREVLVVAQRPFADDLPDATGPKLLSRRIRRRTSPARMKSPRCWRVGCEHCF